MVVLVRVRFGHLCGSLAGWGGFGGFDCHCTIIKTPAMGIGDMGGNVCGWGGSSLVGRKSCQERLVPFSD